jgi:hypothetical protein
LERAKWITHYALTPPLNIVRNASS